MRPMPRASYGLGKTVASTASVVAPIICSRAAVACCAVRYFIVSHRRPVMSFMLKPQHPASPELVETRCTAPMSIGIRLPLTNTSLPTPGAPPETVGELDRAGELGEPAASGLHWSSRARREELRLAIAGSSVTASSAAAISNQYSTNPTPMLSIVWPCGTLGEVPVFLRPFSELVWPRRRVESIAPP
jgi:hypothetical protein